MICEWIDVKVMRKHRKVNLLEIKGEDRIKLKWQIQRQVQQQILEKKLTQCFLKPYRKHMSLRNYPESMQPMIADFMQKAKEQTELTHISSGNKQVEVEPKPEISIPHSRPPLQRAFDFDL
jgi:hypothetical protein